MIDFNSPHFSMDDLAPSDLDEDPPEYRGPDPDAVIQLLEEHEFFFR